MRILVSNDDGIYAPGLWALAKALQPLGEVVVVAPDREQSGIGAAVTLHAPVRAAEVSAPEKGIRAWAVEGTPADSVILALNQLLKRRVDLVVAGINQGANLGEDILVSGTVGLAFRAYFQGISAIALSVASLQDVHFEAAALTGRALVQGVLESLLPRPVLLNVNLPNLPLEEVRGVTVTQLGKRSYTDSVETGEDGRRKWYWIKRNRPKWKMLKGTDIYAIRHRRISITPLTTELTATAYLESLSPMAKHLARTIKKSQAPRQETPGGADEGRSRRATRPSATARKRML